jgi:uncharacterized protein YukE
VPDYLGLMLSAPATFQEAGSGLRAQASALGEVAGAVTAARGQASQQWKGEAQQAFDRAVQRPLGDLRAVADVLNNAAAVLSQAGGELGDLVAQLRSVSEEAQAAGFLIIPPEGVVMIGPTQEAEAAAAGPGAPAVLAAYESVAASLTGVIESIVAAATALDSAAAAQLQGALAILAPGQVGGTFIPYTGAGWIEPQDASPAAAAAYERIRAQTGDVEKIAANTGIDVDVLRQVKKHFFQTTHDVAVGPNSVRHGYFTPDLLYSKPWDAATAGPLHGRDLESFRAFVAHEYVESRLMEAGVPYLSPDPADWGPTGSRITPRSAHILAPIGSPDPEPFRIWPRLGLTPPGTMASDLSNLDDFVAVALRGAQP